MTGVLPRGTEMFSPPLPPSSPLPPHFRCAIASAAAAIASAAAALASAAALSFLRCRPRLPSAAAIAPAAAIASAFNLAASAPAAP